MQQDAPIPMALDRPILVVVGVSLATAAVTFGLLWLGFNNSIPGA
jgi:hypothetical protein